MTDQEKLDKQRAEAVEALHEKIRMTVDEGIKPFSEAHEDLRNGMKELNERFDRMEALARVTDVPGMAEEAQKRGFSFAKVARSLVAREKHDPNWRKQAEFEWECDAQLRANDPSLSPDEYGGFLVAPDLQKSRLVMPFLDYIVPQTLGATVLTGLNGSPVLIPKVVTEAEAASYVEHQSATDTEIQLGQIRMEPHRAQAVITPSRQFLALSGADSLLEAQIGKAVAKKISRMAFSGSGSSGEPIGLKNAPGVNSVDFTASPNAIASPYVFEHELYYKLMAMEGALEDIDAIQESQNVAWAMHAKAKRAILGMKSQNASAGTDSLDVNRAAVTGRTIDTIMGHPFRTTGGGLTGGTTTDMFLGAWDEMVIGYWSGMHLEATTQHEQGVRRQEVLISATQLYDVGFFRPEAFCKAKNFNTASV